MKNLLLQWKPPSSRSVAIWAKSNGRSRNFITTNIFPPSIQKLSVKHFYLRSKKKSNWSVVDEKIVHSKIFTRYCKLKVVWVKFPSSCRSSWSLEEIFFEKNLESVWLLYNWILSVMDRDLCFFSLFSLYFQSSANKCHREESGHFTDSEMPTWISSHCHQCHVYLFAQM